MNVTDSFDQALQELEAKFHRLLETDRQSEEFECLYREVDRQLGLIARGEEAGAVKAS